MSTGTLALIIFVVIALQVGVFALVALYRRKQELKEIGSQEGASQADVEKSPVSPALLTESETTTAWSGFREFIVQHRVMEDKAESICSFYLTPADGQPLPSFKPGQFLTFKLQIKDPVSGESKNIVRCYSLSDSPQLDYYRVSIKRVPAPAGHPGFQPGRSSNYFHDHVQEGMRLSVKAPSGHFYLMEKEPLPVVLVGGGIGITPMVSIANALLNSGSSREIWLFYGVRNSADHAMKEHLQSLQQAHKNFHLHLCYSRPIEQDIEGNDYQHRGHVDINRLRLILPLKRHQFYVCGPRAMMESLVPALEEWGVANEDIYYESFGPATLPKHKKAKPQASKPVEAITVTFSKSGKSVTWNPDAESLLALAEDNDIDVDSGCRAGSCGSCQTKLESGGVEYNQEPDADVEAGHCLLCISKPKNNLTLTA
ncbi:MAG: 2Fe-2S iron-sulfur cluster-binding protein [Candidatus Polarisedimenticolaceae bacterium]|nr:2Fe-2S iron-sulfur cluster-binding protein [Candidatus Polarisedimenticolaceae bacterium]